MNKEEQESRYKRWRDLIDEQEASDLTQTEFYKERGVSSAQLSYYRSVNNRGQS